MTDSVGLLSYKDYQLAASAGLDLLVEVTPLSGSQSLWVYSRFGDLPLWTQYDLRTLERTVRGTCELLIAPTVGGVYYFSIYGNDVSDTGGNYRIGVNTVTRRLSDVSPQSAGNAGEVTLNLSGVPFVEGMGVQLRATGRPTIAASSVTVASPTTLWARFGMTGTTTGVYDVYAVWPGGGEASLPGAFSVSSGTGPHLEAHLVAPSAVRPGRQYVLWLEYANTGDADMPAPLFLVSSSLGVPMRLSPSEPYITGTLQVLGINFAGPAGTLGTNSQNRIPIYFQVPAGAGARQMLPFELSIMKADATPVNWNTVENQMRPDGWSNESWSVLYQALIARLGPTYGEYQSTLSAEATAASQAGFRVYNIRDLFETIRIEVGMESSQTQSPGVKSQTTPKGVTSPTPPRAEYGGLKFWTLDGTGNPTTDLGSLNCSKPTKIILHGWHDGREKTIKDSQSWQRQMANAYRDCYSSDYNVVLVDASALMYSSRWPADYFWAAGNVVSYGTEVAQWIGDHRSCVNISRTHIIGHSFGAHAAGFTGVMLKARYGETLSRITGLDVAKFPGPGLKHGDAQWIDVFESDYSPAAEHSPVGDENYRIRGCKGEQGMFDLHSAPLYWAINSIKDLGDGCQKDKQPGRYWGLRYEPTRRHNEGFLGTLDCNGNLVGTNTPNTGRNPDITGAQKNGLGGTSTEVILPTDPNEKTGTAGTGPQQIVTVNDELRYTVYFENVATATAPAQEVFIVDELDPDLDWQSFRVAEVAFGNQVVSAQESTSQFYARATVPDHRSGVNKNWWVDITTQINYQNGQVNWIFRTLDPETGELPEDALAGFLPPNDASRRGEGHVSLSIKPKSNISVGTLITNTASIVFDTNAAIATNTVTNTIGTTGYSIFLPLILKSATSSAMPTTGYQIFLPLVTNSASSGIPTTGSQTFLPLVANTGMNTGNITGQVWLDTTKDGIKDASEIDNVAGVTITLKSATGVPEATATTDASGYYTFTGIVPGNYTVVATVPSVYGATAPTIVSVSVRAGSSVAVDFGLWALTPIYLPVIRNE